MKRAVFIFSLFFACFLSQQCFADFYIGVIGGGTAGFDLHQSRVDTSTGYYLGGRIGMTCLSLLRIEEEISYQRSGLDSISKKGFNLDHVHGHVNFWSFMTNALIDFDCPFIISPYFGGGVGYTYENGKGSGRLPRNDSHTHAKMEQNAFAWQALVGLKYLVCFGLEASFEYRYFKVKEVDANHKFGLALTKLF